MTNKNNTMQVWKVSCYREAGDMVDYHFSSRESAYKYALELVDAPPGGWGWGGYGLVPDQDDLPNGGCSWADDYAEVIMTPINWKVICIRGKKIEEYGKHFFSKENAYNYALKLVNVPEGWNRCDLVPDRVDLPDGGCFWADDNNEVRMIPIN